MAAATPLGDAGPLTLRALSFLAPDDWLRAAAAARALAELAQAELSATLAAEAGYLPVPAAELGGAAVSAVCPPLGEAARQGRLGVVFARLRCLGEDPNAREKAHPRYTALHRAASGGHRAVARLLLRDRARVESRDRLGFSALHIAVQHPAGLVQDLLGASGDAGAVTLSGVTPLHGAAGFARADVCQLLLAAGADAGARAADGRTPAETARRAGSRLRAGGREEAAAFESVAVMLEEHARRAAQARRAAEDAPPEPGQPGCRPTAEPPAAWEPAAPGRWEGLVSTGASEPRLPEFLRDGQGRPA